MIEAKIFLGAVLFGIVFGLLHAMHKQIREIGKALVFVRLYKQMAEMSDAEKAKLKKELQKEWARRQSNLCEQKPI